MRKLVTAIVVMVLFAVTWDSQPLLQPSPPQQTERKAGRWTPAPGPYYGPRRDR